ncbi:ABC-2 type transport system ATP-binding protein [Natranaerovirga pectinivora]|uniref:ABC-2 type transport system ATP-binding protein n=1 Tax=Natranaerovirga pectinivora TaxID=682400 RepID=A0A4R3MMH2_9FIRM|nr:ABC transporter ATP-binding protein [Natranaerovirga pectinivora]TCT16145.1 ABC-2 type transport system ATP-binding protein [Natranaerovirga pectinivora]
MIEVKSLTKIYPSGKGIFDVSFDVKKGEVFGFLGPNGAGKTTTIRNLMGFTNPTSGSATINGLDCRTEAATIQEKLGYVPGEIAFFDNMTGLQFLKFIADMRGVYDSNRQSKLIEWFELESDRKIRKMSKGMKQKVGLIAAFMHDPEVIILDEPTSGLDPLMQKRFVELIVEERNRGKTILMSSHMFDEVDKTCERVAIIRDGKIVAVEDIKTLKASLEKSFFITFANKAEIDKIKNSGLEFKTADDNKVEIIVTGDYSHLLTTLSNCQVTDIDTSVQTLEHIFMRYYSKEGK